MRISGERRRANLRRAALRATPRGLTASGASLGGTRVRLRNAAQGPPLMSSTPLGKINDLRGRRFGRLTIAADAEPDLRDGHAPPFVAAIQ